MKDYQSIPVFADYDVVVAGGGTAGFAAAAAAAKAGARTLLLEEHSYLGGTCTGAQISMLMGFAEDEREENLSGIMKEVLGRLKQEGGTNGIYTILLCGREDLRIPVLPYDSQIMKRVMDDIVSQSGAHVLFHTRVIDTQVEEGRIRSLVIHNTCGIQRVTARVFIDATFHGSVAVDAGCRWVSGDEHGVLQPGSLMYMMGGVDGPRYEAFPQEERTALACRGIEEGKLYVNNLLARPLPNGVYYSNMSRISIDPMDVEAWSKAEMQARRQIHGISDFFIRNVPGFEHATMVSAGDFTGLRDSRRIQGRYVLSNQDVLHGVTFPDAVLKSSYPIDIHDANGSSSVIKKPETGFFQVPYRAMVTDEVENLILAGRCISTEHEAHACVRVMVNCMRLGQAAGLAAAQSVSGDVPANHLDGEALSRQLLPR